jgi:hypothetical protein
MGVTPDTFQSIRRTYLGVSNFQVSPILRPQQRFSANHGSYAGRIISTLPSTPTTLLLSMVRVDHRLRDLVKAAKIHQKSVLTVN